MGSRDIEESKVNNVIEETQLAHLQYKLPQRNAKYSSERSQEIIEHEMPGMRNETPKEETYNCYAGAGGELK